MSNSTVIKRKCERCSHWNIGEVDHCSKCKHPISAQKLIENHQQVLNKKFEIKRTKFDDFLDKMKQHPYLIVRAIFYVLYATWSVVMFIVSCILFLIAWTPG